MSLKLGAFIIATGVIFTAYSFSILMFSRNLLKDTKRSSLLWAAFFSVINGFLICITTSFGFTVPDTLLMLVFVFATEFYIAFKPKSHMVYWGAMHLMLNIVFIYGFVTSLLAISRSDTLYSIMLSPNLRFLSLILCVMLSYVVMAIFHFSCPRDKLHIFFSQIKQVNHVNFLGTIMFIYLLMCSRAFYYNFDLNLFAVLQISACVLTAIGYYSIFYSALDSSVWITETWKYIILEKQLERQLLHYRSYESAVTTIKIFKHDYAKMFSGVLKLLQKARKDEALEMLEDMDHLLQNNVTVHRQFSNNFLVDAVLHELENQCTEYKISFNSSIFIPSWLSLTPTEFSAVFSALAEFSVNCCTICANTEKRIHLFASNHKPWFTISAEFSCCELTAKKLIKKQQNTIEYLIIDGIAATHNGFCNFEYINGATIAKISVHLNFNDESEVKF